jgi:hypothetical protein
VTGKWITACIFLLTSCRLTRADSIDCRNGTLSQYIALGSAGCSFQNDVFSNFAFTGPAAILSGIAVQPQIPLYGLRADGSGGYDPVNGRRTYAASELMFPSVFAVSGQDRLAFSIAYTVTTAPGYIIRFTGYESSMCGDVEASAAVSSSLGFGAVGTPNCGESPLFESQWADLSSLRVTNTFNMAASDRPRAAEDASGGRLSNYVGVTAAPIAIPEPASWSGILVASVALMVFLGRRRIPR